MKDDMTWLSFDRSIVLFSFVNQPLFPLGRRRLRLPPMPVGSGFLFFAVLPAHSTATTLSLSHGLVLLQYARARPAVDETGRV